MVHWYWARLCGLTVDRSSIVECEAIVPLSQSSCRAKKAKQDIVSLQHWFSYCISVSVVVSSLFVTPRDQTDSTVRTPHSPY